MLLGYSEHFRIEYRDGDGDRCSKWVNEDIIPDVLLKIGWLNIISFARLTTDEYREMQEDLD